MIQTKNIQVLPGCLPIITGPEKAENAVLLIHGYTGNPAEMAFCAETLAANGLRAAAPRLPGHGTNRRDFRNSGPRDWLRRVVDSYLELQAVHRRVHLVGHSMGTLLAVLCAARYTPASLSLLAPAFVLRDWRFKLAPLLGLVLPVIQTGQPPEEEDSSGERLILHREYRSDLLAAQAGKLELLRQKAVAALPRVQAPVLVLTADGDQAVDSAKVVAVLHHRAVAVPKIIHEEVSNATHSFPFAPEQRQDCAQRVLAWILNN